MNGLSAVLSIIEEAIDQPADGAAVEKALTASCEFSGNLLSMFKEKRPSFLDNESDLNYFEIGLRRTGIQEFLVVESKLLASIPSIISAADIKVIIDRLARQLDAWLSHDDKVLVATTSQLRQAVTSLEHLRTQICALSKASSSMFYDPAQDAGLLREGLPAIRDGLISGMTIVGDVATMSSDPTGLSIFANYSSVLAGMTGIAKAIEDISNIKGELKLRFLRRSAPKRRW
jgi:hypothetical protein